MRSDIHRYVIAYDTPDDRRRLKLANTLGAYGDRVQYSVFLVDTTPVKIARLRRALEKVIAAESDSVLICDIGPTRGVEPDRFTTLGKRRRTPSDRPYVV